MMEGWKIGWMEEEWVAWRHALLFLAGRHGAKHNTIGAGYVDFRAARCKNTFSGLINWEIAN
ncbi:MAG: hypothetical protein ABFD92_12980 [Planctomycetaceae bacterium]|nr:hypothetical protein [Planctomycetaceae bacterium]